MREFQEYFDRKLPKERKTCEANNRSFVEAIARESLAAAKSAGRRSEQEELNRKGLALLREAAIHARVTCLAQFYSTLEDAYKLTNVALWRYNAIEVMLTDDLTDTAMRGVGSRITFRNDLWQQQVLFQPSQDFSKIFSVPGKGNAPVSTGNTALQLSLRQEFGELFGKFFVDMSKAPNGFRFYGCDWNESDTLPAQCQ